MAVEQKNLLKGPAPALARPSEPVDNHQTQPAHSVLDGDGVCIQGLYPGSALPMPRGRCALCITSTVVRRESALQRVAKRGPDGWPLATGWRLAQRAPKPEPRLGDNTTDSPEAL